jgi:hypothetical protein
VARIVIDIETLLVWETENRLYIKAINFVQILIDWCLTPTLAIFQLYRCEKSYWDQDITRAGNIFVYIPSE